MTQLRLDNVLVTSLVDAYLNYDTKVGVLTISGSIANGSSANFSVIVPVSRSDTIADIYAENRNTGKKMSLIAGSIHHPYQAVSSETDAHSVSYDGASITVTLSVDNNTGGLIALTSQIWDITAVLNEVAY